MEEEHERIDPLLAAVDAGFAQRGEDSLADVIDALVSTLTGHLAHEERDGLPLIGVALTAAEWRGVGFKIARRNGLSEGGEMFAWMLDGADGDAAATAHAAPAAAPALQGRLEAPLQQNPALVTRPARSGPRETAWMPRSCRWNDQKAASTPYDLVRAVPE